MPSYRLLLGRHALNSALTTDRSFLHHLQIDPPRVGIILGIRIGAEFAEFHKFRLLDFLNQERGLRKIRIDKCWKLKTERRRIDRFFFLK